MIRQRLYPIVALIIFIFSIWYVFYDLYPQYDTDFNAKQNEFSTDRAFEHVKAIAQQPHYVGSSQHSYTRNYIINQLEKLNLKVHTQQEYSLNSYGEFSIPENIVTKIEGKNSDAKALLLMSHFDSAPHSSFGASDAASGVASIIEAIRAFKSSGVKPENDIIICFTDAEEVGLLGAETFVTQHPWGKNIGLVLNFEARGSSGPSNMIVETNHGNAKMIKAFSHTDVKHPLGTSLMYSVYKMLPNDTDSTVFREKADIPSFFFAFIDNHFDYHTALDIPERLDKRSLAHQGDYALNLLKYFSQTTDINQLKGSSDMVYFNLPELGLIYYPFSWIWYMYAGVVVLFLIIIYFGFKSHAINRKEMFLGFGVYTLCMVLSGLLGYLGWQILLWLYPNYNEILQGFPYNSHNYIFAFVCLTLSFTIAIYSTFRRKLNPHNALIAPIFFWIMICAFINIYLPGAAYFVLPLGFAIVAFAFSLFKPTPNLFITWFLGLPSIGLIIPLIQFFPVGLGMKMLFISTLFSVFAFGLLYSFIGYLPFKKALSQILLVLGIAFLGVAHFSSGFSKRHPKPNSLVYLQNADESEAYWATYDHNLDAWNNTFFENPLPADSINLQSKYNTRFTKKAAAPFKYFSKSNYKFTVDTTNQDTAEVNLSIYPNSKTRRIEIYTDKSYNFKHFEVNRQTADTIFRGEQFYHIFYKRYQDRLLTYHVVNQENLNIRFKSKLPLPKFDIYETRFDLLENKELNVPKRSQNMIPKPFVVNDAIIIKRKIDFKNSETK